MSRAGWIGTTGAAIMVAALLCGCGKRLPAECEAIESACEPYVNNSATARECEQLAEQGDPAMCGARGSVCIASCGGSDAGRD